MPTAPLQVPSRLPRMVAGFVFMPVKDKLLLFVAWSLLGLAAGLLRLVPFRRLAPLLGAPMGAVAFVPTTTAKQAYRARLVRCAILRASRVAPFRSDCLPQAFAATTLCRILQVPTSAHLGVRLDDDCGDMAAHAWVCSGPEAVSGGRSFGAYTAVACFISPAFPK